MEFLRHGIILGAGYNVLVIFINSGLLLFARIAVAGISLFRTNKIRSSFLLLVLR